jgi:Nickel responsive protein SCO4226-like
MPLFLVERTFADDIEMSDADVSRLKAVYEGAGVGWVSSFLSADKRKTYCLYEADSEEAILEAARRHDSPPDTIIPVDRIDPGAIPR